MSYNENWPRWMELSIFKFIDDNAPDIAFVYYEGQERKTSGYSAWFEVRMDGPFAREESKDNWFFEVEVNVLVSCEVGRDFSKASKMFGKVGSMLDASIPIFKLGDEPGDDANVKLGCLTVDTRTDKDGIIIKRFGQVEPKVKLIQGSVEVRYWLRLEG